MGEENHAVLNGIVFAVCFVACVAPFYPLGYLLAGESVTPHSRDIA